MPFDVRFDRESGTLYSEVSGILTDADVEAWRAALAASTAELTAPAEFRMLENLTGYEVADQELTVHKRMREVSPRFLAEHGFAVGFWALYETEPPAPSRPGRCTHVAHVHHDRAKMDRYNELLATETERFFADASVALTWLNDRGDESL